MARDVSLSRVQGACSVYGRAVEGSLGRSGQWIVHRGCTGNAERQWSVIGGQWSVLGSRPWGEPRQKALVELLGSCAYGSAVLGVGDFPENYVRIAGLDATGMARRNVAVDLAMNQKDWNSGSCDRIFWRDLLHVEAVLPARVEESEFDDGAEEGASEPWAQVKGLAHAVVGDLAEGGEGRFGGDRAEAGLDRERLQELGSAHRFGEPEDAVRMILRGDEVEPLVNVVAFEEAVGGEWAAAGAVGAGVGEKYSESVGQEELRVSGHADTVVGQAVEENCCVAVGAVGMDDPSAEGDGVWRCDGDVRQVGVQLVSDVARGGFSFWRYGVAGWMEGSVGY
jgi:hypothetical protein